MPNLANIKDCTGCQACVNACPKSAISMKADSLGFLYPQIDSQKCVSCGLCEKSCPILHKRKDSRQEPDAYAFISKSDRKKSSSGGAFSMFARYILANGGVVFGAHIDENLKVFHTYVEKMDDLDLLRGSKYVQSYIGNSYKEAKSFLKQGRQVLFSGTPCQVAGLYAYLGDNNFDNLLITLDLVCHGVPNQHTFDSYCKKLSSEHQDKGRVCRFLFRKLDSWSLISSAKFDKEKKWRILEGAENLYMQMFFRGWTYRESCLSCPFASIHRPGTFTIADFWGIGRHGSRFKKNIAAGVSLVLDNKKRMDSLISKMMVYGYIEKRTLSEAVSENQNLASHVERSSNRESAILDMQDETLSLKQIALKYNLLSRKKISAKIFMLLRKVIHALGLYNIYKTINYKLGK